MRVLTTTPWKLLVRFTWVGVALAGAAGLSACARPSGSPVTSDASAAASPQPIASKPSLAQEAGAVLDNRIQVEFPPGSAMLDQTANKQLDLAVRLFRDANPVVMFATGYSDKSGNEYDNLLLSARRAEAVKRGLVARGIPPDRLLIQALGESELANSADPVAPENRRAIITWRLL